MISKTIVRNLVLLPLSFLTLFASAQILQFPPLEIALAYPSELPEEPPEKNVSTPWFVATHLAIDGAGWFVVSDPVSGTRLLTRRGDFRLDSNNYLITANGYRVQGFNAANTTPTGQLGDIQIDHSFSPATTDPAATMTTFRVEADGKVKIGMSDGTEFTRAQILLQQINRPEHLQRIFPYLMLAEADAEPSPTLQPPGSAGLGTLISGTFSSEKFTPELTLLPRLGKQKVTDEGMATHTLVHTDLAIRGHGAFIVRDPATSELFATRAGMFLIDRNGYVISYDGKRLQGHDHMLPNDIVGDIQVGVDAPPTTSPTAVMTFVSFHPNGEVHTHMTDGTEYLSGIIVLYGFHNPEQLVRAPLGQFSGVLAAQPYAIEEVGQLSRGKTRIEQNRLELVNIPRDLLCLRQQLSFFTQGFLYRTENPTDLAIDGAGFFLLKHPLTGEKFVTRRGEFHLDASGYLVNDQSLRVQGISGIASDQIGDVRIAGRFTISWDGGINCFYTDGSQTNEGFVLLQWFKESYRLRPVGHGLYQNIDSAVPDALVYAGTFGAGGIESSALESPPEPEFLPLPDRHGTRMLITGEPGSRWIIQAKDRRSKWRTIRVINNSPFEMEFLDRTSNRNQHRSYRVLAESNGR